MAIRKETDTQHSNRFAAMLRNSQERRAQGIRPGANRRNWMKLDTLLGIPFEIVLVDFEHESQQYGTQTRVDIELSTGESASFTANATLENQLRAMDAEEFQDVLYTIVQDGTFTSYGKRHPVYLLDYAEDETGKPNSAASNRARVASQKNVPQANDYFEDEDEDEDEDEEEEEEDVKPVPTPRKVSQSKKSSQSSQSSQRTLQRDGRVNTRPAPQGPHNYAGRGKNSAKKPVSATKPVSKASSIETTGNGKYSMGRGRPPLGAARFDSSRGIVYDADGNAIKKVALR